MYYVRGMFYTMCKKRLQLWFVLLLAVATGAIGCSSSDGGSARSSDASTETTETSETTDTTDTWATIRFDVSQTSTVAAAELIRPSITADGINDFDTYDTLGSFLNQNDTRVGMVLYDGIDSLLTQFKSPPTSGQLTAALDDLDNRFITPIIASGGTVILNFFCSMPRFLSKLEGFEHDVLSGEDKPSRFPIYSCAPPKQTQVAHQDYATLVEQVSAYFYARHGDSVVYLFGEEPGNYYAGTWAEFAAHYSAFATGILAGAPNARLGGITPVYGADKFSKAIQTLQSGKFEYTAEILDAPLLEKWITLSTQESLPIDFVSFHLWNTNPRHYATSAWAKVRTEIEGWLTSSGYSGPKPIILATDVPEWANVCLVDPDDSMESYWDSTYAAAFFTASTIATTLANLALRSSTNTAAKDTEIVFGYLIQVGSYSSCIPEEAGFNGQQGIVNQAGIPKPSWNALHFSSYLRGYLGTPVSEDTSLQVLGAWDESAGAESVTLLVSRYVPSELEYVAPGGGFPGYRLGAVFRNNYGYDREDLDPMSLNATARAYLQGEDAPKELVRDLLDGTLDIADLDFPPSWNDFLAAARAAGLAHRAERDSIAHTTIRIEGIPVGNWKLTRRSVDSTYGNAYAHRSSLHTQLMEAEQAGTLGEVIPMLQSQWGPVSTIVDSEIIMVVDGIARLEVEIEANAVVLIELTRD